MGKKPTDDGADQWPGAFDLPDKSGQKNRRERAEEARRIRHLMDEQGDLEERSAPRVVELTSKTWKRHQLLGCLTFAVGILGIAAAMVLAAALSATQAGFYVGSSVAWVCAGITAFGLGRWIYGRWGAWWHHG